MVSDVGLMFDDCMQLYFFLCVWSQYKTITVMQARHIELLYP